MTKERLKEIFHIDIQILLLCHFIIPIGIPILFSLKVFNLLLKRIDHWYTGLVKLIETFPVHIIILCAIVIFTIYSLFYFGLICGRILLFKKIFLHYSNNTNNNILKSFFEKLRHSIKFRILWLTITEILEIPLFSLIYIKMFHNEEFIERAIYCINSSILFGDTLLGYFAVFLHWKKQKINILKIFKRLIPKWLIPKKFR